MKPGRFRGARFVLVTLAAVACLYDPDEPCGPNMKLSEIDSCVCVSGYVMQGTVCMPCGEHEFERNGVCVCEEGYQRPSEAAGCVLVPESGLGADCESGACSDATFSYCARASNGDRYCTTAGCAATSDCPEGYACARESANVTFCQRRPAGMGTPCNSDSDCAGSEATFCEPLISHSCLVQGCSLEAEDCFEGWDCCDVSAFGMPIPICVPEGTCP